MTVVVATRKRPRPRLRGKKPKNSTSAEDTGAPPLILLDEVAAHLDADRRAALYDEIAALGAQAWMTGTGPELFESMGDRAQFIDVTEENGESRAVQRDKP